MEELRKIRISVRNLVEFILREGDIDNRRGAFSEKEAMQEGGRLHRKIQHEMGSGYRSEVPLSVDVSWEDDAPDCSPGGESGSHPQAAAKIVLTVEGRADGIFSEKMPVNKKRQKQKQSRYAPCEMEMPPRCARRQVAPSMKVRFAKDGAAEASEPLVLTKNGELLRDALTEKNTAGKEVTYIDEIKGTYRDVMRLERPVKVHLAQAKCYAYIYASKTKLPFIGVQMTYCTLEKETIRRFRQIYSLEYLEKWFLDVVGQYRKWARFFIEWKRIRQASIQTLEFPYPWRSGQRDLAASVYRTIVRRKKLFIQAPTGTGKTLSAIFPAVKAIGEEKAEHIFYATAKTITRTVAEEAFATLREKGLHMKTATLTAKEKICFLGEPECNPDACPYAKGHYDRVNDAVYELITQNEALNRTVMEKQARKWNVCPFEMGLDAALWVDSVICDYNYIFDPRARLKRFFGEGVKGDYVFLIDEAHNLVERGRDMYSAVLYKEDFTALRREFQNCLTGTSEPLQNKAVQKRQNETLLENEALQNAASSNEMHQMENAQNKVSRKTMYALVSRRRRPDELERTAKSIIKALNRCNSWFLEQKRRPGAEAGVQILSPDSWKTPCRTEIVDTKSDRETPPCCARRQDTSSIEVRFAKDGAAGRNAGISRCGGGIGTLPAAFMNLCGLLETFLDDSLNPELNEMVLDLYFQARRFLDTSERQNDNYVVYTEQCADGRFLVRLYCVDISENLQECLDKGKSTILFSATFLPIGYYKSLLSTLKDDYAVYARPVFNPANRLVLIGTDVSSRYTSRSPQEYQKMAEYVYQVIEAKRGNYMVFFSSYRMMDDVADQFDALCLERGEPVESVRQMSRMSEEEREEFLGKFEQPHPQGLAGFCVMGGIFGEGIDLREDRLIGAILVGPGLPQVCTEREILREFYDRRGEDGFFYAYLCPGMNRVLQSAGRVIRTENDRGVILLLDERFATARYRSMFPAEWEQPQLITLSGVQEKVRAFWRTD